MFRNKDSEDGYKKSFIQKLLNWKIIVAIIIAVILIPTLIFGFTYTVQQGETGVVKSWGQVTDVTTAGFHTKMIFQDTIEMFNVKVRSVSLEEATGTADLQQVTTQVTVNYHIDQTNVKAVYTQFNQGIENNIIVPSIQEALKATTAKYTAEQLINIREQVKQATDTAIRESLVAYGVTVDKVSITDFDFSAQYQAAIDAKQTAQQNALEAQNHLAQVEYEAQQQVINANANATATITMAQANANATVITANATATAMQTINTQLTSNYILYQYILNGEYLGPTTWINSGNGTSPFIMIPVEPTNSTKP
jgi:regulator of protease activity HflC (stomatin/prohibitin superfamily)